ncbi:MobC family plasmid mobilization relaxosome protein [Corynebacterium variabile]|uniref:MobC family plasmid mobilization relaxosome protein n=1 Tax=Corynebacterium variabile TaxID=1727 RepID=UPI00264863D7|nr:MobC family plasmid mobilization relaxosome protein [Corynebacterium variabile]MDN6241255.1 MobC family plasmid mobilization relaxosome protein [Corynebacterium variabile]MDN6675739.1 MobC family plasmid mobilization relaxosome protein [Corynebacterium variabile]MDN6845931.1 MobC family plasmid mobilization relaxosome protein [Corynebacterium variabile]
MSAQHDQTAGSGVVVSTRFSAPEVAQLDRVASRRDLSRSAVIRAGVDLLDATDDRRRVEPEQPTRIVDQGTRDAVLTVTMEIRRIGNNVNQMARRVNGGHAGALHGLTGVVAELHGQAARLADITDGIG